jgi:short-subunit dehydrogenase
MNKETVLITGCSSGIGLALAKKFANQGYKVLATARNEKTLDSLKSNSIEIGQLDVCDPKSIDACLKKFMKTNEKIDILVNNAGFGLFGPIVEIPLNELKRQFETNCFGVVAVVEGVLPYMPKHAGSKILNFGSISGIITTPFSGAYCASKAAVRSLSEAMRMELSPFGIQVTNVEPGAVKSSFSKNVAMDLDAYRGKKSLYSPLIKFIEARRNFSQINGTPAEDVVRDLVRIVKKKKIPAVIRLGSKSTIFPLMKALLPRRVFERILSNMFGLNQLKPTSSNKSK